MKHFDIIFRSCEDGCKTRTYGIRADSFEAAEKEAEIIADKYESHYDSWFEIDEG